MVNQITAVVGTQWGDEGKGKIVDYLAAEADCVVRYQGGSNAGHTINNPFGRFSLHLLPSGAFYPNVTNILGAAVALDISKFVKELDELLARNVPHPKLLISDRTQILLPHHILLDKCEEQRLAAKKFGSTQSGIAPFYAEVYRKLGVQVADLFDKNRFKSRVSDALVHVNCLLTHLYNVAPLTVEEDTAEVFELAERIKPLVGDVAAFLHEALAANKKIVLEGQLGTLRDPLWGIHPHTTSSSTLAGFAAAGAGIPPQKITRIVGVAKAYSSMVGTGHFVSKIQDPAEAEALRKTGGDRGEFGATTGRPRDVGWFDAVATRYGAQLQGTTEICLTNLDVLGYLDEVPVCVGYEIDGVRTDRFPVSRLLEKAKPIFERLPGWGVEKADLAKTRTFADLPANAKAYVNRIEELLGVPVKMISVGPAREDIITR
jgi:adenylosuccinate synthase